MAEDDSAREDVNTPSLEKMQSSVRTLLEIQTHEQLIETANELVGEFPDLCSHLYTKLRAMPSARRVFVRGLAYSATDADLKEAFSVYGDVVDAVVMIDKFSKKSKGFGFVTFADADGAEAAMLASEIIIAGRRAFACIASQARSGPSVPEPPLPGAKRSRSFVDNISNGHGPGLPQHFGDHPPYVDHYMDPRNMPSHHQGHPYSEQYSRPGQMHHSSNNMNNMYVAPPRYPGRYNTSTSGPQSYVEYGSGPPPPSRSGAQSGTYHSGSGAPSLYRSYPGNDQPPYH